MFVLNLPAVTESHASAYERNVGSVFSLRTDIGHGTGFVISESGLALTNAPPVST